MNKLDIISEVSFIKSLLKETDFMGALEACNRLLEKLHEAALSDSAKKNKRSLARAAAKRIVDYNREIIRRTGEDKTIASRKCLCGASVNREGRQIMCDGYKLVALNPDNHIEVRMLQEKEESKKLNELYEKVMGGFEEAKKSWFAVPLPSRKEMDIFIAEHKEDLKKLGGIYYNVLNNYKFNAYFLRDMVTLLPKSIGYIPKELHQGMFIQADNGRGLLLPVTPLSKE